MKAGSLELQWTWVREHTLWTSSSSLRLPEEAHVPRGNADANEDQEMGSRLSVAVEGLCDHLDSVVARLGDWGSS